MQIGLLQLLTKIHEDIACYKAKQISAKATAKLAVVDWLVATSRKNA